MKEDNELIGKYSTESQILHGEFTTEKWDYSHHIIPPISCSASYRLDSVERGALGFEDFARPSQIEHAPIYVYDRLDEPTRSMLETRLAKVESGEVGVCFATGMAAISAVFGVCLRTGDRVTGHTTLYGCTFSLFENWFPRMGLGVDLVDMRDLDKLRDAIRPETKTVYFESPANPTLELIDIAGVRTVLDEINADRDESDRVRMVIDNTFATPFCQRPIEIGCDIVLHSLTKNIGGFGTDMGGVVVTSSELEGDLLLYRKDFGGAMSPKVGWQILTYGLPTLPIRVRHQTRSAYKIAEYLENNPKVARVNYPGLESFVQADLARKQMLDFDGDFAPGNMIYFELASDKREDAVSFLNWIGKNSYALTLAVSLGQLRTLVESPTNMTHFVVSDEAKEKSEMSPTGIRMSVGIERAADIIADMESAFESI